MKNLSPRSRILRALGGAAFAGALALAGSALAHPPDHPHGPPPEAFTACDGKASGDACTVHFHDTDIGGTCDTPPGENRLACRPNGPPPGAPPGPPPEH